MRYRPNFLPQYFSLQVSSLTPIFFFNFLFLDNFRFIGVKNVQRGPTYPSLRPPPIVASCITIVYYPNQEIDINIIHRAYSEGREDMRM